MTMTKMTTFVTFPELVSFADAVDSLFTGYVDIILKRLTTFSGCIGNFSTMDEFIWGKKRPFLLKF